MTTEAAYRLFKIHIPVDILHIVGGPSNLQFTEVMDQLNAGGTESVELVFTLKTGASTTAFTARLAVCSIGETDEGTYGFVVVYNDWELSGVYNTETGNGHLAPARQRHLLGASQRRRRANT
ncbi:hypothetical protein JNJ66_03080 [Candidatus Saccharibacteria bacterium]|nr:hypothetical protein [Candidatus Saccharibacteria bacterium]